MTGTWWLLSLRLGLCQIGRYGKKEKTISFWLQMNGSLSTPAVLPKPIEFKIIKYHQLLFNTSQIFIIYLTNKNEKNYSKNENSCLFDWKGNNGRIHKQEWFYRPNGMFLRKSSSERHAEAVFSQYDLNSSQVPSQLSALQPSAQYQPETCNSLNGMSSITKCC